MFRLLLSCAINLVNRCLECHATSSIVTIKIQRQRRVNGSKYMNDARIAEVLYAVETLLERFNVIASGHELDVQVSDEAKKLPLTVIIKVDEQVWATRHCASYYNPSMSMLQARKRTYGLSSISANAVRSLPDHGRSAIACLAVK